MVTKRAPYTIRLGAGLGLVDETKALLELWEPGMRAPQIHQAALESGRFPNIADRRLRNIVTECFAPRYLVRDGAPAGHLKRLVVRLAPPEINQLFMLFTSRANPILGDFIRQVYWERYAAGAGEISNDHARAFVERAVDDGKTATRWSDRTIQNVAGYLTGCCADYGLLENGQKTARRIAAFRMSPRVAAYLAHDLHFSGLGDNSVMSHQDWGLFGARPRRCAG